MKKLVVVFCLALTSPASADEVAHKNKNTYSGTYITNQGNESGGVLKVMQSPDHTYSFDLECNRGVPSYNSGVIGGTIVIKDGKAVYRTTEFAGLCELKFNFTIDAVSIIQNGSDIDCGFGHGVYCDGMYLPEKRTLRNKSKK